MDKTRQLYIISGCNGAGKTTASFNPESMAIEAGRLMLKRIDELLTAHIILFTVKFCAK